MTAAVSEALRRTKKRQSEQRCENSKKLKKALLPVDNVAVDGSRVVDSAVYMCYDYVVNSSTVNSSTWHYGSRWRPGDPRDSEWSGGRCGQRVSTVEVDGAWTSHDRDRQGCRGRV
jgi:hypothetical protein